MYKEINLFYCSNLNARWEGTKWQSKLECTIIRANNSKCFFIYHELSSYNKRILHTFRNTFNIIKCALKGKGLRLLHFIGVYISKLLKDQTIKRSVCVTASFKCIAFIRKLFLYRFILNQLSLSLVLSFYFIQQKTSIETIYQV